MKKVMMAAIGLMMAVCANAQYLNDSGTPFEQGKFYVGASVSGLDLSYHKGEEWRLGLNAEVGYLFLDNWMVLGAVGYQNSTYSHSTVNLGAGVRYYFSSNGIYAALKARYVHEACLDDFRPEINVGYAFFLNHYLTIQPEVYYEQSFKESDLSGFGVRLGFGVYF